MVPVMLVSMTCSDLVEILIEKRAAEAVTGVGQQVADRTRADQR